MLGMLRPPCQALRFSRGIFRRAPWRVGIGGVQACPAAWQDWLSQRSQAWQSTAGAGAGMLHTQEPREQSGSAGGALLNHACPPGKSPRPEHTVSTLISAAQTFIPDVAPRALSSL